MMIKMKLCTSFLATLLNFVAIAQAKDGLKFHGLDISMSAEGKAESRELRPWFGNDPVPKKTCNKFFTAGRRALIEGCENVGTETKEVWLWTSDGIKKWTISEEVCNDNVPGQDCPESKPDPHFTTFTGIPYDFHGECDLVYMTCPTLGMDIHMRTRFVPPKQWSTIADLVISIGGDVFEIGQYGNYTKNGSSMNAVNTTLSGYPLLEEDLIDNRDTGKVYTLYLGDVASTQTVDGVEVTNFERTAALKITFYRGYLLKIALNGYDDILSDCMGLSGTVDDPVEGAFLVGRSGRLFSPTDGLNFGPSWQVDPSKGDPLLFQATVGPQLPGQTCLESPLEADDRRHLRKLMGDEKLNRLARESCGRHLKEGSVDYVNCIFDVMVTGDAGFADDY